MRFHSTGLALTALLYAAGPAGAQQATVPATPSVEGYLCTFAGKCDGVSQSEQVTRDAPETKGFRLARPTGERQATPTQPSAQMVTPRAVRPAYRGAPGARPAMRDAGGSGRNATAAANLASLGQVRTRADLMIGFDLNSARISRQGIASTKVFAQALMRPELANTRFAIEGHTDLRGSRALNMSLSARRAQAVADLLVAQGVDRSRLVSRGFGYDVPLPGRGAADPANRRVEAELQP